MWYEKRFNEKSGLWWVFKCTATTCMLVKTFKTEKGADGYIKRYGR